eukprot:jgi/Bigna1/84059/fgenesh1_pg.121_\
MRGNCGEIPSDLTYATCTQRANNSSGVAIARCLITHSELYFMVDPLLVLNVVVSVVILTFYVVASIITQTKLVNLHNKGVDVQTLGHPHVTSTLLAATIPLSVSGLIEVWANMEAICPLLILIRQASAAASVAIIIYATLLFTRRITQVQSSTDKVSVCSKQFMGHALRNDSRANNNAAASRARQIARKLAGSRPRNIALICFCFGMCIMFFDPLSRRGLTTLDDEECTSRGATITVVVWFIFMLPYLYYLHTIIVVDPYLIYRRLSIVTFTILKAAIAFMVLISIPTTMSELELSLTLQKVFGGFQIALWYAESYIPLYLTQKKLNVAKNSAIESNLVDTLVDSDILEKFENFLIREWSAESLDFLMEVIQLRIDIQCALSNGKSDLTSDLNAASSASLRNDAKLNAQLLQNTPKQANQILHQRGRLLFERFICEGSESQINLSAKSKNKLVAYFKNDSSEKSKTSYANPNFNSESKLDTASHRKLRKEEIKAFCSKVSLAALTIELGNATSVSFIGKDSTEDGTSKNKSSDEKRTHPEEKAKLTSRIPHDRVKETRMMDEESRGNSLEELANVFEDAKKEIFKLLELDSHLRFQTKWSKTLATA